MFVDSFEIRLYSYLQNTVHEISNVFICMHQFSYPIIKTKDL